MTLSGQVALVTGASRGIGKAIALALAGAGAAVGLIARSAPALDALAVEIEAAGGRALALPADVLDQAALEAVVQQAFQHFGRLDILVNNAGSIILQSFDDTPVEAFRQQMELHYMAAVVACKAAVPLMRQDGGGHILNMASISGTIGYGFHSAYSPAKGALIRLSEAMADDLKADKIRVNCIAPNAVDTALFDDWVAESGVELDRGEWIQPQEIGQLAVFLSSPAARSITGETIVLRGIYPS